MTTSEPGTRRSLDPSAWAPPPEDLGRVEGALRPAFQRTLAEEGANVNALAVQWLRVVRSPHPERDWVILANFVTWLVLHDLAHPTDDFDPTSRIVGLVNILVKAT
jgi:hypothetical protein